jgi:hypothetical protein
MEQEDAIEAGIDLRPHDIIKTLAEWLYEDEEWLKHVLTERLYNQSCKCRYDEEYGNDYCEYWKAKLGFKAAQDNMNKAQKEYAERLRERREAHQKAMTELGRQGLLP